MRNRTKWAILGGGNGGQALAGHLGILGFPVRIYDIFERTIEAIRSQGGIAVEGAVEGFGKVDVASLRIDEVVADAEIIMVVAPAIAHRDIARACAPHLSDGQVVCLHPGATCGALEFLAVLREQGCTAKVVLAETNSLVYACRSRRPGQAEILGIKGDLVLSTLPAREVDVVCQRVQEAFPQIRPGRNVMETSLGNANAVMHPAPSILNLSLIESRHDWLYYWEGITPTIGRFVEDLDQERIALARSFDLDVPSIADWYRMSYSTSGVHLDELCRNNPAYAKIAGQKDFRTRYILEDVPTGLVPMIELGTLQGLDLARMKVVAALAAYLLQDPSLLTNGRTLANLGLAGMSAADLEQYLETGVLA